MTICYSIPYPEEKKGKAEWNKRFSLNAYRDRARDARYIHMLVREALKRHKVKQSVFIVPVVIRFRWDDRLDIDNHAALGKMITDAMKGYLLQDDSPRWVKRVTHEFWDGGQIGVEVRPA